jgi:hypothetical protein
VVRRMFLAAPARPSNPVCGPVSGILCHNLDLDRPGCPITRPPAALLPGQGVIGKLQIPILPPGGAALVAEDHLDQVPVQASMIRARAASPVRQRLR